MKFRSDGNFSEAKYLLVIQRIKTPIKSPIGKCNKKGCILPTDCSHNGSVILFSNNNKKTIITWMTNTMLLVILRKGRMKLAEYGYYTNSCNPTILNLDINSK